MVGPVYVNTKNETFYLFEIISQNILGKKFVRCIGYWLHNKVQKLKKNPLHNELIRANNVSDNKRVHE